MRRRPVRSSAIDRTFPRQPRWMLVNWLIDLACALCAACVYWLRHARWPRRIAVRLCAWSLRRGWHGPYRRLVHWLYADDPIYRPEGDERP